MNHRLNCTMWLVITGAVCAAPLETASWLVDLGRDYPRTSQAGLSDADAEITLLFMTAAGRLNPQSSDAFRWQHDMLAALGREGPATEALERYLQLEPTDVPAWFELIDRKTDVLQTAEQRAALYATLLGRPGLPGTVISDLQRRQAEFHLNRGEPDLAMAQAKAAVEAFPLNFTARELIDQMRAAKPDAATATRAADPLVGLRHALLGLSASPSDPERARFVADQLMLLNLPEPAERLYAHAIALLRISDPFGDLPAAMTDRIAALQMLGRDAEAAELILKASDQWRLLMDRAAGLLGPAATARMAWFYTRYESRPDQAEKLARAALAELPESIVAQRALGSALRQVKQLEDAAAVLAPAAERDAASAAEYAQVLAAVGDPEGARRTLSQATTRPADPASQWLIVQTMAKLGVPVPASRPAPPEAMQELTRFAWKVLDYPMHPDKYLSLTLEMAQSEMPLGEPWMLTVRARNIGPFAITFGEDLMVSPALLVMVLTAGDRPRMTAPVPMSFKGLSQLQPGQSAETRGTIDLGEIRSGLIGTPQMTQEASITAVLSPARYVNNQGEEAWAPDIGGLVGQLQFRRPAFSVRNESMGALFAGLQSADAPQRIAAMEKLAMLLAEQQHVQAGRLRYPVRDIDITAVQAAILARAGDPDWQVRARWAEVIRWFTLDKSATNTATSLLSSDPHWLVRGLILRALADQYGARFQSVLAKAAQADPDEWVRKLAAALQQRTANAATQPASAPQ